MSAWQPFLDSYGYAAIFVGAFLEGETLLAMGGFAAQRGYLNLPIVVVVGVMGGFLGDQLFFFLGRRHGSKILVRFPSFGERAYQVDQWLYRYHAPLIIAIRFLYGFRIVGPIVFGMGRVSAARFVVFNLIGACLWGALVAGIGFLFGQGLELILSDAQQYELGALGAIAVLGVLVWAFHRTRR